MNLWTKTTLLESIQRRDADFS